MAQQSEGLGVVYSTELAGTARPSDVGVSVTTTGKKDEIDALIDEYDKKYVLP